MRIETKYTEPFHAHLLKKKKRDRPLSRVYSQNVCPFLYMCVSRKQTQTQTTESRRKDKITLITLSYSMQKNLNVREKKV